MLHDSVTYVYIQQTGGGGLITSPSPCTLHLRQQGNRKEEKDFWDKGGWDRTAGHRRDVNHETQQALLLKKSYLD